MGMETSTEEEYSKAALLPGTEMPVLNVWGEGRKGKRIQSLRC